jgi:multidrug efflux pump subunit AcrB
MKPESSQVLLKETHNTARFFVEHPQVSWLALGGLLVWGVYGYLSMPQAKDPEISIRVAVASCSWPGATAQQVEQLVTKPMEEAIAQNKRIHPAEPEEYGIRSVSYPGQSVVWVQLDEGIKNSREQFSDIDLRLRQLQAKLPQGAGPIQFQSDFGDTSALLLTVVSPDADATDIELRARDMQTAIEKVRSKASHPSKHVSIMLSYPTSLSPDSVRRIGEEFRRTAEKRNCLHDAILISGNGFMGVDGESGWSDEQIAGFVSDFAANGIPPSSAEPDVWPPIIVRDPARVFPDLSAQAGPKYTYAQLEDFTDLLARSLQGVPQTSRVEKSGVLPRQVTLEYSQERLAAYGLKPADLPRFLAARNITAPGGQVESATSSAVVSASGQYEDARSIGNTIVGQTETHLPVYLRDLVQINESYQNPPGQLNYYSILDSNGKLHRYRAATISVYMRSGEQIHAFGKAVDAQLEDAKAWLPSDLMVERTSDQPLQVRQSIDLFMDSLYEAILLVVIIALVGFWDWRSAVLLALSIPITLAMTFGIVHALGIDLQQVSIATLIIALGLLVDDPVVANDAIKRELAAGLKPTDAAWIGPTKLATAIVYATVTNIIAYLPFLMVKGITGEFLYSLPVVMTAALVSSRLVSMTFIPLIARYLLKPTGKHELSLAEKRQRGFYGWYQRGVGNAIEHRWKVFAASGVFLLLGVVLAFTTKTQYFPNDVQYWSYIDIWLPNGTSIMQTRDVARQAEFIVNDVLYGYEKRHGKHKPDASQGEGPNLLQSVTSFIGSGGPRFWFSVMPQPRQPNYAQLLLRVNDKEATPELVAPLQEALNRGIPGAQIVVQQLQVNPVEFPVEIRIASTADVDPSDEATDNHHLREIAERVAGVFNKTQGVSVVQIDWLNEAPEVKLQVNADKANLAGVTNADAASSVLLATNGVPITTLRQGDQEIPVVARLQPEERANLSDLKNNYVASAIGGQKIPLGAIADTKLDITEQRIRRQDHFRTISVHVFPVNGVLPSEILKRAQGDLSHVEQELPSGYRLIVGGEQAKQRLGFKNLAGVLFVSAVGIYAALLLQFKNAVKPLIVFAAVPFGVVGALLGLFVMRTPFGFMAFLGVASLIGVIVSHIIVLFDFIEEMREKGEPLEQALRDAGIERLRPVLITVAATVFALFPLAIHGGPLWKPLCFAQIGGLTIATLVTLLLVPVLYSIAVLDLKIVRWDVPSAVPPGTGQTA